MNTNLISLLLILAFASVSCSTSASQTTANNQTADNVQTASIDNSYAVYSALLKNIETSPENGEKVTLLVVNESTDTDKSTRTPIDQVLRNLKVDLSPEFKSAFENYKIANKESQKLTKALDLIRDYTLISRNEFDAVFKGNNLGKGWEAFYKKFPHSAGFITFSKVGFDAEKKHAFVYMELGCGWLCADASYILLTKEQEVWQVTKRVGVWAS